MIYDETVQHYLYISLLYRHGKTSLNSITIDHRDEKCLQICHLYSSKLIRKDVLQFYNGQYQQLFIADVKHYTHKTCMKVSTSSANLSCCTCACVLVDNIHQKRGGSIDFILFVQYGYVMELINHVLQPNNNIKYSNYNQWPFRIIRIIYYWY